MNMKPSPGFCPKRILVISVDNHMRWQALESLGALSFNDGKGLEAEEHFTAALQFTGENRDANKRICGKLKHLMTHGQAIMLPIITGSNSNETEHVQVTKPLS